MKKYFVSLVLLLAFGILSIYGCGQGPEGPAGPQGPAGPSAEGFIVFKDGAYPTSAYNGTRDSYISSTNPLTNYGATQEIVVDSTTDRGLIKFDLSSITPTVEVFSAILTLYVSSQVPGPVYIKCLDKDWDETVVNWISAEASTQWTSPGGDFANQISYVVVNQVRPYDFPLDTNTVKDWINNPNNNFGMIITNDNSFNFYSREYTNANYRPALKIVYFTP